MQRLSFREGTRLRCCEIKAVLRIMSALTKGDVESCDGRLIHDKVQNHGAVATVHIRIGMNKILGFSSLRNVESVFVVTAVQTNLRRDGVAFFWINVQMQSDNTVALVDRFQIGSVNARLGKRLAVENIAFIETNVFMKLNIIERMGGQMQSNGAVTLVRGEEGLCVFS